MGGRGASSGKGRDLPKQSAKELKRGIESLRKQIEIHRDKIANPEKHIEDKLIKGIKDEYMKGVVRKWQKDINRFELDIERIEEEIKKRRKRK